MYAVPLKDQEKAPGDTWMYRYSGDGVNPTELISDIPNTNITTIWDVVLHRCAGSPKHPYLSYREVSKNSEGETTAGPYKTLANDVVESWVRALGSALVDKDGGVPVNHFPEEKIQKNLKIVGIWAKNRVEWIVSDFACSAYGLVSVPLYDTLGKEATTRILHITNMTHVCVEGRHVSELIELSKSLPHLKTIISFDPLEESEVSQAAERNLHLYYFHDLLQEYGSKDKLVEPTPGKPDEIATIIFTSGTTGIPKGVMHTNKSLVAPIAGYITSNNRMRLSQDDVIISYLPLAHVYEHVVFTVASFLGCKIGFYQGDVVKLVDDMQELKPSVIIGVPRVFNKMYDKIMKGVQEKSGLVQSLVSRALKTKVYNLEKYGTVHHTLWDALLFNKIKRVFGGKLRVASMGGAAMDVKALKRLSCLLGIPICEGWGMTEIGISFVQDYEDGDKGTIGGPWRSLEYKVRSLPDMHYFADQDPPRGELLVRGPCVMKGYFLNPELTAEVFVEDGWMKTGDVVEVRNSGAVAIIDRSKSMFKLQQGEFVAPEKVENIYLEAAFVGQIYVYGTSKQTCLVAVVVPDEPQVMKWAAENNKGDKSYKDLMEDSDLNAAVLSEMEKVSAGRLHGFEKVKGVYLTSEAFTIENDLLTPTFKTVRKKLNDLYKDKLEEIYSSITPK